MLDRVGRAPRHAFAAREVVQRRSVLGIRLDHRAATVGRFGILTRLVEWPQRAPKLPAERLVRLPRNAADREQGRPRLLGECRSRYAWTNEDERVGRRLDAVAVDLEDCASPNDVVELLLPLLRLVVLVDDPVARGRACPGIDPEGRDAEVMPYGTPGRATIVHLFDLIQVRDFVATHRSSFSRLAVSPDELMGTLRDARLANGASGKDRLEQNRMPGREDRRRVERGVCV